MSFTNQKLPKGKEYWGVKDRLKERERGTDTKTQTDGEGREGKGRELYLRRRLLRSTGGP
jgi:hypothetical protein